MARLSYQLQLHFRQCCPMFLDFYRLMYCGETFLVYRRVTANLQSDVTIFRTSDKCIRLIFTRQLANFAAEISYQTFRSISGLTAYLRKIVVA